MENVCYKNIVFYNGKFYTNKENIKVSAFHNRNDHHLKSDQLFNFIQWSLYIFTQSNTEI